MHQKVLILVVLLICLSDVGISQSRDYQLPTYTTKWNTNRTFLFLPENGSHGTIACTVINSAEAKEKILLREITPVKMAYGKPDTIIMQHYKGNETELYKKIRKDGLLQNAFIDNFYFDSLVDNYDKKRTGKKVISCPIRLINCIIEQIWEPGGNGPSNDSSQMAYNANESVSGGRGKNSSGKKDSCYFNADFRLINSIADYFTFKNCVFKKQVVIKDCIPIYNDRNTTGNFNFEECNFHDTVSITAFNFKQALAPYLYFNSKDLQMLYVNNEDDFKGKLYDILNKKDTLINLLACAAGLPDKNDHSSVYFSYGFNACHFCPDNGVCILQNTDQFTVIKLGNCLFGNKVLFSPFDNTPYEFKLPFYPYRTTKVFTVNDGKSSFNIKFSTCKFYDGIDFSVYQQFIGCKSDNNSYSGKVNIYNVKFLDSSGTRSDSLYFSNNNFMDKTIMVLGEKNCDVINFPRIHPISLQNIIIETDAGRDEINTPAISYLININTFFTKTTQCISSLYPESIAGKMKDKLDHTYLTYEAGFYKSHFWESVEYKTKYLKYIFLETLVGNGYNGEINFLVSTLIIILFFSLLYFLFYRQDVVGYMNKEFEGSDNLNAAAFTLSNFCRCIWISGIILVNPKFPAHFFKQRPTVFYLFTLQWIISIIMILLFLVYIASKYQFLSKLTGI